MGGRRLERAAGPGAPDRAWRAFLVVGLCVVAATAVVGDPVRGWLVAVASAGAAGAAVAAVRRDPDRSNPAWLLAGGSVLLVPAYLLWYPLHLALDLDLPDPGITDALFLPRTPASCSASSASSGCAPPSTAASTGSTR